MNHCKLTLGRLFGIFLVLSIMSCGQDDLPDVPRFDALGFTDALDVVREQVHAVYEEWLEKPLDAERNGRLGMHLSVYGKNAASEILYRRARALAPDEFRWTYYLAFALSDLGRLDEAIGMFREALKIDAKYPGARIQLASLLLQITDVEGSGRLYQSITIEYPKRVEGWLGLGRVYSRKGDTDAAIDALQRARSLGPQYGEVHYALAMALRARGDIDAAARELAAYERTAKNRIPRADKLMRKITALHVGDESYLARGSWQFQQGQFKKAVQLFRIALEKNPASADAWALLVSTHFKLGEMDMAGEVYRQALAAGIVYARLHLVYGDALLNAGQLDAAREVLGKAIELDAHYALAYSAMGELELRSGDSAAAAEQFRLSLAARPNDRGVRFSLAQALNSTGQYDEAAGLLEPLMTDPALDRTLALKELALAYYGLGRKDEAIDSLQRGREAARKSYNMTMVEKIDVLLVEWQKEPAE